MHDDLEWKPERLKSDEGPERRTADEPRADPRAGHADAERDHREDEAGEGRRERVEPPEQRRWPLRATSPRARRRAGGDRGRRRSSAASPSRRPAHPTPATNSAATISGKTTNPHVTS